MKIIVTEKHAQADRKADRHAHKHIDYITFVYT